MFKTKEQIEEMAIKQTIDVIKYVEKELLESVSEGVDEWFLNHNWKPEELMSRQASCRVAWQAAKLSSKAQIDTLKQRELEYQGDLRGKDRIINDKSNQIIEITKEIQEKDAEIERLKKLICKCDTSVGFICESCHEQMNWAKYQEVIKDIEWLLTDCDQDLYTHLDKIDEIKAKYGLDKKEG